MEACGCAGMCLRCSMVCVCVCVCVCVYVCVCACVCVLWQVFSKDQRGGLPARILSSHTLIKQGPLTAALSCTEHAYWDLSLSDSCTATAVHHYLSHRVCVCWC